jgi:hypothetical protein
MWRFSLISKNQNGVLNYHETKNFDTEIAKYYKTARENRQQASVRNDLQAVDMYNQELSYWETELSKTGEPTEKIKKMLNQ